MLEKILELDRLRRKIADVQEELEVLLGPENPADDKRYGEKLSVASVSWSTPSAIAMT